MYIKHKKQGNNLIILAISVFFFFSFTSTSEACLRIINVTTNFEEATFIINGPESYSGSGTSWSVEGVPGGTYVIVFGDVEGYITPPSESHFLPADNITVVFNGEYEMVIKKKNIIVGAGPGSRNTGLVKVFNDDGTDTGVSFIAHRYKYGVNVAAGDFDGDGIDEIITGVGPGPQNPAEVNVFDSYGNQLTGLSITAYEYKYGVNIASADFDGDGIDEIITGVGPGPQNPAEVKVFVYDFSEQRFIDSGISFTAYDTKYGVKVTAGDVDGDGIPEIITECGPGPTYMTDIKIWKVDTASSDIGQWSALLITY